MQWALLVDDANSGLLCSDDNTLYIGGTLSYRIQLAVENMGSLDSGLSMEFRRVRYLEKDILHDVFPIRPLELEWFALEEDVIKSPGLGSED